MPVRCRRSRTGEAQWPGRLRRAPRKRRPQPGVRAERRTDETSVAGYVAITYVDALGNGGCTVHVAAMFDVTGPVSPLP
jgi:hypothetical protein